MNQSKGSIDKLNQSRESIDKLNQSKGSIDKLNQTKESVDKLNQSKGSINNQTKEEFKQSELSNTLQREPEDLGKSTDEVKPGTGGKPSTVRSQSKEDDNEADKINNSLSNLMNSQ